MGLSLNGLVGGSCVPLKVVLAGSEFVGGKGRRASWNGGLEQRERRVVARQLRGLISLVSRLWMGTADFYG